MKTTKDFDCVKMMREIRKKISEEIIKMDNSQILDYFRIKSEEFEKEYGNSVFEKTGT